MGDQHLNANLCAVDLFTEYQECKALTFLIQEQDFVRIGLIGKW